MGLKVLFRLDATAQTGAGHAMRSLALADRLAKSAVQCQFLGNLRLDGVCSQLKDVGYSLEHCAFGAGAQKMVAFAPDWVVFDSYDLKPEWIKEVRSLLPKVKICIIDDHAGQSMPVELVVNSAPEARSELYQNLVSKQTKLLLGARYALLRLSFRALRANISRVSESVNHDPRVVHLFVGFGGGDTSRYLNLAADALNMVPADAALKVTVLGVNGVMAKRFEALPFDVKCLMFSTSPEDLMVQSDLALGAGGGMALERCCLGLPSIALEVASNQKAQLKALERAGALKLVKADAADIASAISKFITDSKRRYHMSEQAFALVDGRGTARVAQAMLSFDLKLRPATMDDDRFIFDARYGVGAGRFYRSKEVPEFHEHQTWLRQALEHGERSLLIAEFAGQAVAHVRLDPLGRAGVEVNLAFAPKWRGKALGSPVLLETERHCQSNGIRSLNAEIQVENLASRRIFEQAGYDVTDKTGAFVQMAKTIG